MTTHQSRATSAMSDSATVDPAFQASHEQPDRHSTDGGAENVKSDARDAAESAQAQVEQTAEELARQAHQATEAAKKKAVDAARAASESGSHYASQKKQQAASEIGVLGDAIRKAAGRLREEKHDSLASYVEAAAEQLECLRASLENKDIGELVEDTQSQIRRHPTIAYGTLFAAGLAAVRFFKASRPPRHEPIDRRNFSDPANRPASAYGHDPALNSRQNGTVTSQSPSAYSAGSAVEAAHGREIQHSLAEHDSHRGGRQA